MLIKDIYSTLQYTEPLLHSVTFRGKGKQNQKVQ